MSDLITFIESITTNKWPTQCWNLDAGTLSQESTPGVLKFTPKKSSDEQLAISVGIHGNETAPVEIIWDILKQIKSNQISPELEVLFIFGHAQAMLAHKRFIDFNLNRLFNGNFKNHQNTREAARACELEKVMSNFFNKPKRWHLDLHTAIRGSHHERFAVRPLYPKDLPIEEAELNICASMGVEAILKTNAPATTFSGYSAMNLNALSFTIELGKVMPFGENNHAHFSMARATLINILNHGNCDIQTQKRKPLIYNVVKELINDHTDYEFYPSEDYLNFTPLKIGQAIERNRDGLLKAKKGQSIVFPNGEVPIGQRTGLLVSL